MYRGFHIIIVRTPALSVSTVTVIYSFLVYRQNHDLPFQRPLKSEFIYILLDITFYVASNVSILHERIG